MKHTTNLQIFGKQLKSHTECSDLASRSDDFLHVICCLLREGIVNYIRHWNEIITVPLDLPHLLNSSV